MIALEKRSSDHTAMALARLSGGGGVQQRAQVESATALRSMTCASDRVRANAGGGRSRLLADNSHVEVSGALQNARGECRFAEANSLYRMHATRTHLTSGLKLHSSAFSRQDAVTCSIPSPSETMDRPDVSRLGYGSGSQGQLGGHEESDDDELRAWRSIVHPLLSQSNQAPAALTVTRE